MTKEQFKSTEVYDKLKGNKISMVSMWRHIHSYSYGYICDNIYIVFKGYTYNTKFTKVTDIDKCLENINEEVDITINNKYSHLSIPEVSTLIDIKILYKRINDEIRKTI